MNHLWQDEVFVLFQPPDSLLNDSISCYDMMYGTKPTLFMLWATEHKAKKVLDGLGILVK